MCWCYKSSKDGSTALFPWFSLYFLMNHVHCFVDVRSVNSLWTLSTDRRGKRQRRRKDLGYYALTINPFCLSCTSYIQSQYYTMFPSSRCNLVSSILHVSCRYIPSPVLFDLQRWLSHVIAVCQLLALLSFGRASLLGIIRILASFNVLFIKEVIDRFLDLGYFGRKFSLSISLTIRYVHRSLQRSAQWLLESMLDVSESTCQLESHLGLDVDLPFSPSSIARS